MKYAGVSTNFSKFGASRNAGFFTQFIAIFIRNWLYLLRNPRTLGGIFYAGVFSALLNLCLYIHVGDLSSIDFKDPASSMTYLFNLKGFAFLLANNISFSSSSSVIL